MRSLVSAGRTSTVAHRYAVTSVLASVLAAAFAAAASGQQPAEEAPARSASDAGDAGRAGVAGDAGEAGVAVDPPGRAVFLKACATCHGEDGSGQGVTVLDRPARSFRDGGFSFGNTTEALQRTITTGIPGTPMPGFGGSLREEDLVAVAAYVGSLGPPAAAVDARDAVLSVGPAPLVVRGILAPIAPDAPLRPRGLLIGTTDGLSFEYRIDDVRLLGVREGGFVERTDWTGRGGTPLRPLGQVVHLLGGGDPPPCFFAVVPETARRADALGDAGRTAAPGDVGEPDPGVPLACRFTGSWIDGRSAGLDYELTLPDGARLARVRESCRAVATLGGSGFHRTFVVIFSRGVTTPIALRADDQAPAARVDRFVAAPTSARSSRGLGATRVWVSARPEGGFVATGVRDVGATAASPAEGPEVQETPAGLVVTFRPSAGGAADGLVDQPALRVTTILASGFTDETRAALIDGLSR